MAPSRDANVSAGNKTNYKRDISAKVELVIGSRKHANDIFDVLAYLQSDEEKRVVCAAHACCRLFAALLERGDLFVGQLPGEERLLEGSHNPDDKYRMFVRHRYNSCIELLPVLMSRSSALLQETCLCVLMKLAAAEAKHPLQDQSWSEHYNFPRELVQRVVQRLLSDSEDMAMLISRFQEFLEMDDVRFYVINSVRDYVARLVDKHKGSVMPVFQNNVFALLSNINMPSQQSEMSSFMVKPEAKHDDWKAAKLKLSYELVVIYVQLPGNMYKKVLVIFHESILPYMSEPTLMIDFLTAAYDVGGAISLLALNGLFVLIHKHNLEYPDFYKKLYSLMEPSVFHAKYRARFFHLANLFLSSTHLPAYLVAAFAKRLSRLALTAPPAVLLMLLPFICNLICRHPSCRVLIHRPTTAGDPCDDPYIMEEEDPAQCHALDSSLWELKTLQKHYYPDVAKAAMAINQPLSSTEVDVSELLELSPFELMERELKETPSDTVPLEFDSATHLLRSAREVLGAHFSLD
uniref:CCAAT-binding factor domain-containing protein n=1 Tax=Denticeps clupeoides TaxID=299321 RepID=A0AAY4A615_9TELE